ncbi:MAG: sialate O-acetylesterase [Verrucomicrobiaceae bacterium]|nr:sialate O-acetylesterase [Verrucomicrobiaceae bacterium]
MKRRVSALTLFLSIGALAHADVKLPSIFTDHLVLQRGETVPVWGTAKPGEEVKVNFAGQSKTTKADKRGRWKVALDAMKENAKPADLVIAGKNSVTIKDVLVGEVWICSGQSNMQWTVASSNNAEQEIKSAKFPAIRMFNIERETATSPQDDCKGVWLEANPQNVGNFSAAGYFFGRKLHEDLKVPVGLINTSWGGTRVEAWTSMEALKQRPSAKAMLADWTKSEKTWDEKKEKAVYEKQAADYKAMRAKFDAENNKLPPDKRKPAPRGPQPPVEPAKSQHHPAAIYNRMIASIIPYAVKGAIWYQGESNQKRAMQYQELLPTMINDWRTRWGKEFSFYIVQLAEFGNGRPPTTEPGVADPWVELQEAQLLTALTLSKCGLAVANDIGEEKDIHPKNKQEVGRRLALWALAKDYGRTGTLYSGPIYKSAKIDGDNVRVNFDQAAGLKTRDGKAPATFQIAGSDQKWQWAKAKIDGEAVVVWNDAVKKPVGVRYAWTSWSKDDNLVNKDGLPASCFRTDDFIPSTLGVVSPFAENAPAPSAPAPQTKAAAPAKAAAPPASAAPNNKPAVPDRKKTQDQPPKAEVRANAPGSTGTSVKPDDKPKDKAKEKLRKKNKGAKAETEEKTAQSGKPEKSDAPAKK